MRYMETQTLIKKLGAFFVIACLRLCGGEYIGMTADERVRNHEDVKNILRRHGKLWFRLESTPFLCVLHNATLTLVVISLAQLLQEHNLMIGHRMGWVVFVSVISLLSSILLRERIRSGKIEVAED